MAFVTSIERLGEKRGLEKGMALGLERGLEQGMKKGLRKGKRDGRLEGEAILLQRQLTRKFGALPEALQQRIQTATPNQLEIWSLNILDAQTLDDVFNG